MQPVLTFGHIFLYTGQKHDAAIVLIDFGYFDLLPRWEI